jgi:hypothetical protein
MIRICKTGWAEQSCRDKTKAVAMPNRAGLKRSGAERGGADAADLYEARPWDGVMLAWGSVG